MADKMLIDASHEEETRVVVVRGNRIEEFDFESQHKKQIRGNIYLAKVTRVEPSLQAAFVDYGGNRHGFLAFAEIHPDYYQIPLADRQALLKAEAEEHRGHDDFDPVNEPVAPAAAVIDPAQAEQPDIGIINIPEQLQAAYGSEKEAVTEAVVQDVATVSEDVTVTVTESAAEVVETAPAAEATPEEATVSAEEVVEAAPAKPKRVRKPRAKKVVEKAADEAPAEDAAAEAASSDDSDDANPRGGMAAMIDADTISEDVDTGRSRNDDDDDDDDDDGEKEVIESVGAEDAMEEVPDRAVRKMRKQYRIQEVIKRRQILLVQVAKEERGNKGAALTTYLSLAGRYSVLMPNTARGGGISRKITQPQDRKRLKEIARDLEVPQGMGVILRTAGANRTRVEIKRDFEYLMRLWENVRTLTLNSTAPCLVYEEGSLIKRSIRDLYNKDISEIVVSGEQGYREAKDFMKMLMPSHAKVVQPYRDIHPIFARSGIEAQLDRMLQPQVTLKSGGYLIINQTEALVSIDVNSGRSTREHSIEETALQTNLEAAEEVARQLRLRDLAGLVVIDFIDMEEKRNNRAVEKRLKDCLKNDRARIQVGRISHFGLLEMSRQRIRASVLESTTHTCPHCNGTGHVRSESSIALHVLRGIEEYLLKNTTHDIIVRTTPDIALYLLNHKRGTIVDYEGRFGLSIFVMADANVGNQHFAVDKGEAVENPVKVESLLQWLPAPEEDEDPIIEEIDEEEEVVAEEAPSRPQAASQEEDGAGRKRKRRRRRRNRNGNGEDASAAASSSDSVDEDAESDDEQDGEGDEAADAENASADAASSEESKRKRRRRGKRGGRRNRTEDGTEDAASFAGDESAESDGDSDVDGDEAVTEEAPASEGEAEAVVIAESTETAPKAAEAPRPRRTRRGKEKTATAEDVAVTAVIGEAVEEVAPDQAAQQTETVAATVSEPAVVAEEAPVVIAEAVEPVAVASEDATETGEAEAAKPDVRANRGSNVSSSAPVVTSSGKTDGDDTTKPRKGGWWQKRGFL